MERSKWLLNHFTNLAHVAGEAIIYEDEELSDGSGGMSDVENDRRISTSPRRPKTTLTRTPKRGSNPDGHVVDAASGHIAHSHTSSTSHEATMYHEPSKGARILKLAGAWYVVIMRDIVALKIMLYHVVYLLTHSIFCWKSWTIEVNPC